MFEQIFEKDIKYFFTTERGKNMVNITIIDYD